MFHELSSRISRKQCAYCAWQQHTAYCHTPWTSIHKSEKEKSFPGINLVQFDQFAGRSFGNRNENWINWYAPMFLCFLSNYATLVWMYYWSFIFRLLVNWSLYLGWYVKSVHVNVVQYHHEPLRPEIRYLLEPSCYLFLLTSQVWLFGGLIPFLYYFVTRPAFTRLFTPFCYFVTSPAYR